MFWKNYKTIIGAIIGIIPIVSDNLGFHIPTNVAMDFTGLAIFIIGMIAKDFDK
jgi:hypothetical protein